MFYHVLTNVKPCPNATWDNEWTLQFAHNTLCFVEYDTCASIAPMFHVCPRKAIDMTMKYMQIYAFCIGWRICCKFIHTQEARYIKGAEQSQD